MERNQSWLPVIAGVVAAIVFALLMIYFGAAAAGHPRVKHVLLFLILAVASLLVVWFTFPKKTA
jgi:membrane protease YdiL (CAAX protease family)